MVGGLSADHGRQLKKLVEDLVVQTEADGALVSDEMGNVLAQSEVDGVEDVQGLSAVSAGTISATKELAKLVGEESFDAIFHRGRQRGLYVQSLPCRYFLLVVFGRRTTPGIVKHYVDRMCGELAPLLQDVANAPLLSGAGAGHLELAHDEPFL